MYLIGKPEALNMTTFSQQLILTVLDKFIIGLLLVVAGYWFGKQLERYRTEQGKALEQFKTEQNKVLDQLRGEQALRKEYEVLRDRAKLDHLQSQLEELYGPLLGLLQYGHSVNQIHFKLIEDASHPVDVGIVSRFFTEKHYLPLNEQICELLRTKVYLLNSETIPESFQQFLAHAAQLECQHNLWKDTGMSSDHIHGVEFPVQFRQDVEHGVNELRKEYNEYVSHLSDVA